MTRFLALVGLCVSLLLAPLGALAESAAITRAEGAALLLLSRSLTLPYAPNQGLIRDLQPGKWYEPYLLVAEKYGILRADPLTQEIRPQEFLNRAEFTRMLGLTFGITPGPKASSWQDVSPNAWYAPDALVAEEWDLFREDADTLNFHAEKLVTPHEAMIAVQVVLERRFLPDLRIIQAGAGQPKPADLAATDITVGTLDIALLFSRETQRVLQVSEPAGTHAAAEEHVPEDPRTALLLLVNQRRVQAGLAPLRYNAKLADSAQRYAKRMEAEDFFSHTAPGGGTLKDRLTEVGYYNRDFSVDCLCVKGYKLGENLAKGPSNAQKAFDAWMKSPSHRAALLNPEYSDTGIGIDSIYWVQHFGGVILPGATVIEVGN